MSQKYRHLWCRVTPDEFQEVERRAQREGLSIANYLRHAVNALARDEGDDVPLPIELRQRERPDA